MNIKKMLSLYGIKWNPFAVDLPVEGFVVDQKLENFCWRIENLVMDGGFAMITGPVGTGKSVALRWLSYKLGQLKDVQVAEMSRPQSGMADFYRELGGLFGINLHVSNRWGSYRLLREKWMVHIDSTLFRPILLIDEAQEMMPAVLSELRLIASSCFDSRIILTIILAGDERLPEKFKDPDLIPLGSRIKTRLLMEHKTRDELVVILNETIKKAGNPALMTKELIYTLAEYSMGNYRAMMNLADDVLVEGLKREAPQLDERLFLEFSNLSQRSKTKKRRLNE